MDKREKILKAALELFNQYGFDNTPTARITKEAGVATGTLFNYFKNKEELINVLYLSCKDSLTNGLSRGFEQESTFRSKLKRIYINYIVWSLDHTDEFLFFQQFCNAPCIGENTRKEGVSKFKKIMALMSEGIEQEIIKNVNLDYMSSLLMSIMNANTYYFIDNPSLAGDDDFLETSFSFLWDSIKN
ncbi:TetR/AcrR family transcriptional regulator [Acetobacterium woodii]|uniref:Transcriptional regulator TetR family n=1 Tax=Acetobacterium woodii (strain ATCC 29683 / DSM 1030 / JCM 2381 / KCTC 1655 / WB1) TaxID=931626 RepID=H6LKR2_ACEWD|nr:TetR/AcrR family transcriptional regulator [Acetobacterium woodii]AFA48854.1 transcriptional regulator TetR family [Acetobacterium woodii DSM 1030]